MDNVYGTSTHETNGAGSRPSKVTAMFRRGTQNQEAPLRWSIGGAWPGEGQ